MKKILTSSLYKFYSFLFATVIPLSFYTSCKEKEETGLTGRFINESFLRQVSDSIPGLIPVYCYEMNFSSADSVDILYGFEKARLAYKKSGNKYILIKALQEKDMVFTVNENQTITLIDSAWNGNNKNSTFSESTNKGNPEADFISNLNSEIIAGDYNVFKANKPTGKKISFKEDGTVSGIEKFSRYTLCYSGDCVGEIYPISNSITLTGDKNESVTYAFKSDKTNKTIGIYHIEAPVQDIKGERAIKELAFDLRK